MPTTEETELALEELASRMTYQGNAVHKRNPQVFGLKPGSGPRPGKTLCDGADAADVPDRAAALSLLQAGVRRGLVSVQLRNSWPQNVWAISNGGVPLEAMLTNSGTGEYHGYPMQSTDPLVEEIRMRWRSA